MVDFETMRAVVVMALLTALSPPLVAGTSLHFSGQGFSFRILEPDGWVIDSRAALQIANFIMYRRGDDWRQADTVVFARLVPRSPEEQLKDFVEADRNQYAQGCPFFESQELDWNLSSPHQFLVRAYTCPSVRKEIVAVTRVPRFFVVFALTSQPRARAEAAFPVFQQLLSSFEWIEEAEESSIRGPKRH